MRDALNSAEADPEVAVATAAVSLAALAIERLVAMKTTVTFVLSEDYAERMYEAAYAVEPAGLAGLVAEMRQARVSASAIIEAYIPETARRLGKAWETDRMGFSDVTLGTCRLHGLLQDLGPLTAAPKKPARPCDLLVIAPMGEQHTLGVSVLAARLRREGHSVTMQIAPTLASLATLIESRHFEGALISVGVTERAETTAMLIKTLKTLTNGKLPIVIGGAVLMEFPDFLDGLGADLVTMDISKALDFLGTAVSGTDRDQGGGIAVSGHK